MQAYVKYTPLGYKGSVIVLVKAKENLRLSSVRMVQFDKYKVFFSIIIDAVGLSHIYNFEALACVGNKLAMLAN